MIFTRFSGAGNTFLLADHRSGGFCISKVPHFCSQADVDGVILLENSSKADFAMRIFNRDGSEAAMCGNGLRCLIHYLQECGVESKRVQIETLAGIQEGWLSNDEVCIKLSPPSEPKLHLPYDLHFINTGVPHAVLLLETVAQISVNEIGKSLRYSPFFSPEGANINFACLESEGILSVRTYERGVEAETQACGTGAVASALIANKILGIHSPAKVRVHSGQILTVFFNPDWSEVILQGPVTRNGEFVFKDQMSIMAAT
jgi:diaminopimelate epimerase